MYDAVARTYTVHYKLDDKLIESRTVRDRKSLEEAMTRVERLPVFSVAGLPRRVAPADQGGGRARLADDPLADPGRRSTPTGRSRRSSARRGSPEPRDFRSHRACARSSSSNRKNHRLIGSAGWSP